MKTRTLTGQPNTVGLMAKAAVGVVRRRHGDALPDTELVLPDVRADVDRLARYARVCGFDVRDELPPTYPHVLAFGLAMRLMADRDFPFPMVGLVHINNVITQHRPLLIGEPLTLRVRAAGLRPHQRGTQFELIHIAEVSGEPVWRDVSTYLHRGPSKGPRKPPTQSPPEPEPPSAIWHVGADIGRRYAAVSGDRNPIHLHRLAARAFGFRRAIAHGMWLKARCLAALSARLPDAFTVEVAFKRPVLLPASVAFSSSADVDGWRFTLRDDQSGRPHLTGRSYV